MAKNRGYFSYIGHSKYMYVTIFKNYKLQLVYNAQVKSKSRVFLNERDAAIYADKLLIMMGKEPVNILKRVKP